MSNDTQQQVSSAAYITSLLEDWPAPSQQQRRTVMGLLYGTEAPASSGPSEWELERQRQEQERADALQQARQAALSLTACDVCNLQPEQHAYAQRGGIDSHEWTPGRADKILKKPRPASKKVSIYDHDGLPHVSVGEPAKPKKRRGRPPVDVCKRGHDQTAPGARGVDGRQCLACRSIIKAANKAKRTEGNNG
jgi:hypothetical protein